MRGLRALSTILIVSGTLLLADAGLTLVWQEPISALYAQLRQNALEDELEELEREDLTTDQLRALERLSGERRRLAFLARAFRQRIEDGDPIGRIRIPRIDLNVVAIEGTGTSDLRSGPGHYPDTSLPGQRGTVAIAGHRTTYGAPFRRLDDLERGNRIELRMPYATFRYEVERTRIVRPTATEVVRDVSYDRLVLTACHPLYSAAKRIVVFARFVDATPRTAPRFSLWRTALRVARRVQRQEGRRTLPTGGLGSAPAG